MHNEIQNQVNRLFFEQNDLDEKKVLKIIQNALKNSHDGELFLEARFFEALTLQDGNVSDTSFSSDMGFGLRGIVNESTAFSSSNDMSLAEIEKAAQMVAHLKNGPGDLIKQHKIIKPHNLYGAENPINQVEYAAKIALLQNIDSYVRAKDPLVKQVSANVASSWQAIHIMRQDSSISDIRPLSVIRVSVQVERNGRRESGSFGFGGRESLAKYVKTESWKFAADEALRIALLNLESIAAPGGEIPVVLGSGWPGVLLHEAVGHGLEGDFNRKNISAFSGKIGQQVAAKGVTVIDDGTIAGRRGSLNVDDEGTKTQRNVLIEDGILRGYMQDRLNARLMNVEPTGNGRRESYAHLPMPRMTNTFMLSGDSSKDEMIKSVKHGVYARNFLGGQVDITSGDFVFSTSEAYLIENGEVKAPVKGATLSGNGPKVMPKIKLIGNDLELDNGIGVCGKDGQSVPVGVGQPHLLVGGIVVGGSS